MDDLDLELEFVCFFIAQLLYTTAELNIIGWVVIRRPVRLRPAAAVHNYIFDFFKTISWILFKLDGEVLWVGLYSLPSLFNWSRSSNFLIFYDLFFYFWGKSLKIFSKTT